MEDRPENLILVGPRVYRRGTRYLVRLRDGDGRQWQIVTRSQADAELLARDLMAARDREGESAAVLAAAVDGTGLRSAELAELRSSDVELPRVRARLSSKAEQ
mgnify:CR=1 FL=1